MSLPGTVFENEIVTILDTREMDWEEFPGLEGGRMKVLSRDESGEPAVMLLWFPPDVSDNLPELPYRHYHATGREHFFFLSGEFPHWEYPSAEAREGQLVLFREGYYLDRRPGPGGMHGLEAEPTSRIGCLALHWRTGTGNISGEQNFEQESIEVPFS